MEAIRIKQRLESDTLHLPQIRPLVGKQVEIIVMEDELQKSQPTVGDVSSYPLRGSVIRDDDPFGPAIAAQSWEANH